MSVPQKTECLSCGALLAFDARFCQRCGTPVGQGPGRRPRAPRVRRPDENTFADAWERAPRIAALVLVGFTVATTLFALLVLVFDVFVESGP